MLFAIVLYQLISLMLIAAVGALFTKLGIITKEISNAIGNLMTKACLPCLLISSMQMEFNPALLKGMGLAAGGFMLVMTLSALLILPFAYLFRAKGNMRVNQQTAALVVCSSFPNVVYVGRPLIEALYGSEASPYLTIIALVFTVTVFSIGILLISSGSDRSSNEQGLMPILSKSLCNPAVIGGVIGITLFLLSIKIPHQIMVPLEMMSSMVTPLSMIIIGSTLMQANLKEVLSDIRVYAVSFVRLVAVPIVVYFCFRLFITDPVILGTLVIGSCLPVGANAGVIAALYDNNPVLAAKSIFMSTLLCLITTPLIVLIFLS
ncbi:MAG: AEC family transporter [Oscillospiraceae bacterium]|nr:AEC family transporter [Oscillospiraceae bacterium]